MTPAEVREMAPHDSAVIRRFWARVDVRGPDECWEWTGSRKPQGYGQFAISKRVATTASRFSLALSLGRGLLPTEFACHRCDNPPCVNPAHLFAGTGRDNQLDCISKGRARRAIGVDHRSAILTEDDVRAIRAFPRYLGHQNDLAAIYGVSNKTIQSIRAGRIWKHVQ